MVTEGFVRKGIGGFYYVETAYGLYTCKARGKFRKEKISPCAGDQVMITAEKDGTGSIDTILPRKNFLVRPPVANIDRLFIVVSMQTPNPDPFLIDKTVAAAEVQHIEPVVVFTKTDLKPAEELEQIYHQAGLFCFTVSSLTKAGLEQVRSLLEESRVSVFTGNTGAGKSSLLNALFPDFSLKTGEVSQKLGRGRHTTREVELYKIGESTYVADTPGFSTFDIQRYEIAEKERLVYGFREFVPFLGQCRFTSCSHTCEMGCALLKAVQQGKIHPSRLESYRAMYEEIKDVKQWQKNKIV